LLLPGYVQIQVVYFDVTPEVNGRTSAMAANDVVKATLP
jgi:hypothetical protein